MKMRIKHRRSCNRILPMAEARAFVWAMELWGVISSECAQQDELLIEEYPAPQEHYIHKNILRVLIFGSLHNYRVIHHAARDCTWKARILSVIDGVSHYMGKSGGTSSQCHYIKSMQ